MWEGVVHAESGICLSTEGDHPGLSYLGSTGSHYFLLHTQKCKAIFLSKLENFSEGTQIHWLGQHFLMPGNFNVLGFLAISTSPACRGHLWACVSSVSMAASPCQQYFCSKMRMFTCLITLGRCELLKIRLAGFLQTLESKAFLFPLKRKKFPPNSHDFTVDNINIVSLKVGPLNILAWLHFLMSGDFTVLGFLTIMTSPVAGVTYRPMCPAEAPQQLHHASSISVLK